MSVQVTLYGLSFLVLSLDTNPILIERFFETARTPEELLDEIKKTFNEELVLSHSFSQVNVIFGSHYYTLVPATLFDETKASEYLKFNTKILANDFVSYDTIENYETNVVYVPFININNYLYEKFGNFPYFHSATLLLKYFLDSEKFSNKTKVFLNVEKSWFDCIIISKGNIELCNSYPFKTPEDFLYFTLFVFEQLQLNPDTIEVKLTGAIDENDSLFTLLYTYIRNISFIEKAALQIENLAPHKNFVLKALA